MRVPHLSIHTHLHTHRERERAWQTSVNCMAAAQSLLGQYMAAPVNCMSAPQPILRQCPVKCMAAALAVNCTGAAPVNCTGAAPVNCTGAAPANCMGAHVVGEVRWVRSALTLGLRQVFSHFAAMQRAVTIPTLSAIVYTPWLITPSVLSSAPPPCWCGSGLYGSLAVICVGAWR